LEKIPQQTEVCTSAGGRSWAEGVVKKLIYFKFGFRRSLVDMHGQIHLFIIGNAIRSIANSHEAFLNAWIMAYMPASMFMPEVDFNGNEVFIVTDMLSNKRAMSIWRHSYPKTREHFASVTKFTNEKKGKLFRRLAL
jgi:hypothetical protein